jgi:hypothetical protein
MDKKQMKAFGIVCLVICAVCICVAIERYNTTTKDIVSYDFATHSMKLRSEAIKRLAALPKKENRPFTPFVVVVDGVPVYLGTFTVSTRGLSHGVPTIVTDERYRTFKKLPPDTLVIERAYPSADFAAGPDPRNDDHILAFLVRRRAVDDC